jgi:uncharacterized protein YccT (UPF0319 family)
MKKLTLEEREAAIEARREYRRKWNRENADKVKAAQLRYWFKKAQAMEAERKIFNNAEE